MQLTSVVIKKRTLPSDPFSLNSTGLSSTSFSLSSASHRGWVKSAVPTTVIPFSRAHWSLCSKSKSLEQAREYFEWRWRSAMMRIRVQSNTDILVRQIKNGGGYELLHLR